MSTKDFYRAFEDKHRGSRELIQERIKVYLPFVLPLKEVYPKTKALDIGCGRGEWLELLTKNGFVAEGIDLDGGMLQACRDLSLTVQEGDGIVYLKEQESESFSVISAFHVVEHISSDALQELIKESLRVLTPGGLLILETPNPENIKVATENFYLDPTHIKPIPSTLLKFIPEHYGYKRTKILRLQESKELLNRVNINLLDVFGGVSPDYAVVAQKDANEEILKLFESAFTQEVGISLVDLAFKFEEKFINIEQKVIDVQNRVIQAQEIANQAQNRATDAQNRAIQAERQSIQAQERATRVEENYHLLLQSSSWKVTKPLRLMKHQIKSSLKFIDTKISNSIHSLILKKLNQSTQRPSNKPKQLLIDCSFIYTTGLNTGIQRVVRNIVNNIDVYAKEQGLKVQTVALLNGSIIKVDINQKIKATTIKNGILSKIINRVQFYIASYRDITSVYEDDILLMLDSTWHLDIWPSIDYAKGRGVKVIGVTYDLIPISHSQFCDDNLVKLFSEWYDKSLLYFDGYISISKTVMLDMQKYLISKNVDISKYSFDYFNLGSDFKQITQNDANIRENLQKIYAKNKSTYLIVSTIEPRKNHRYLFETFKKLWEKEVDVCLVIVGRVGWKTEALIAEMQEHKEYNSRLWIFNDLDDNELNYCYKNAKALLFPSFVEGYGLPIIESLQNSLPVLASDTAIHREVGGEYIDYFDIEDEESLFNKIEMIETDKQQIKEVNIEDIKILSWSESAKDLLEKIPKS